jgi:hypothetical protein
LNGDTIKSTEWWQAKGYIELAASFDPALLQQKADDGTLTQNQANALIMLGAMQESGMSYYDAQHALENFFQLPAEDQKNIVAEMSERTVTANFDWEVTPNDDGTSQVQYSNLSYESSPLTNDQRALLETMLDATSGNRELLTEDLYMLQNAAAFMHDDLHYFDGSEVDEANKLLDAYSPSELFAAADAGMISRDVVNVAILLRAFSEEGVDGVGGISQGMKAFSSLSPADQQRVIETMIQPGAARTQLTETLFDDSKVGHDISTLNPSDSTGAGANLAAIVSDLTEGRSVNANDLAKLAESGVMDFSPEEIMANVPDLFTHEQAGLLIVATGLKNDGLSDADIATALDNFSTMKPEDQNFIVAEMSKRQTQSSLNFSSGLSFTSSPASAEQQAIGTFLVNEPADQLDGIQDFVSTTLAEADQAPQADSGVDAGTGVENSGVVQDGTVVSDDTGADQSLGVTREEVGDYLAQTHNWDTLPTETQSSIVDQFMSFLDPSVTVDQLGNFAVPVINDDGSFEYNDDGSIKTETLQKPLGPEDLRDMGLSEDQTIDVGTLMFLVLMERLDSQQDIIRDYEQEVEEKNNDADNASAALSKLRAATPGDDGTVDLGSLTFETESGKEVDIVEFCQIYGIDLPTDADGNPIENVTAEQLSNVTSNVDSFQQSATSDADNATQYLQRAMDKMTNTNQMLTNFESTWTSMLKAIINNLRV